MPYPQPLSTAKRTPWRATPDQAALLERYSFAIAARVVRDEDRWLMCKRCDALVSETSPLTWMHALKQASSHVGRCPGR